MTENPSFFRYCTKLMHYSSVYFLASLNPIPQTVINGLPRCLTYYAPSANRYLSLKNTQSFLMTFSISPNPSPDRSYMSDHNLPFSLAACITFSKTLFLNFHISDPTFLISLPNLCKKAPSIPYYLIHSKCTMTVYRSQALNRQTQGPNSRTGYFVFWGQSAMSGQQSMTQLVREKGQEERILQWVQPLRELSWGWVNHAWQPAKRWFNRVYDWHTHRGTSNSRSKTECIQDMGYIRMIIEDQCISTDYQTIHSHYNNPSRQIQQSIANMPHKLSALRILQTLVRWLHKTQGRDKLCKTLQYLFLILHHKNRDQDYYSLQFQTLFQSVKDARKLFRLFKSIIEYQKLLQILLDDDDNLLKIFRVLGQVCFFFYWFFDNISIVCKIKLLRGDYNKYNILASIFWLLSLLTTVPVYAIQASSQPDTHKFIDLVLDCVKYTCDMVPAANDSRVVNRLLGREINPYMVGIGGLVSGLVSCYQNVKGSVPKDK